MTESQIQAEILVAVTALPHALFWRSNSAVGRAASGNVFRANVAGCADITGSYRGRFVAIEVKTPTGRQSQQQMAFQRAVERSGGIYILARSAAEALEALA